MDLCTLWIYAIRPREAKWLCIWCYLNKSDAHIVAVRENWHMSCSIREGCMSSSCLTRTLPAGCVCCLWPYLSPYVLAGCMVREESHLWTETVSNQCGCCFFFTTFATLPTAVCIFLILSDSPAQENRPLLHCLYHSSSCCNNIYSLPSAGEWAQTHTAFSDGWGLWI